MEWPPATELQMAVQSRIDTSPSIETEDEDNQPAWADHDTVRGDECIRRTGSRNDVVVEGP